jgi:TPR repeat protein
MVKIGCVMAVLCLVVGDVGADPAALASATKACDSGDAKACADAGRILGDGDGVPQDVPSATKLLAKGCAGNSEDACRMLGNAAKLLEQDPKTVPLAIPAFRQLCERGVGGACAEAGWQMEQAKTKDSKLIAKLYEQACKLDDGAGCYHHGRVAHVPAEFERACRLHDARGCVEAIKTAKTPAKAFPFYEEVCRLDDKDTCSKGCKLGDAEACVYMGDKKRALELRTKGCAANDAKSCFDLSYAYHKGEDVKVDHAMAQQLDAKACKLGALDACFDIAERKYKGLDQPEDKAGGVADYEDLCKRGYPEACGSLGFLYRSGKDVAKDSGRAAKLFAKGCVETCAWCCFEAAEQIKTSDRDGAIGHFRSACRWGDRRACEALDALGISVRADPAHTTVFRGQ